MMNQATKLILVKHAMPDVNPEVPSKSWQLSRAGRQSCVPLADYLKRYEPLLLFSSDEPKAELTAQLVGARLGLTTQVVAGLHEHERTSASYGTPAEFHANITALFANMDELVYGEETAQAAAQRFSAAIEQLVTQRTGHNIVVVAHGTVITLFTAQYNQIVPFDFWKRLGLPSFVVLSLPDYQLLEVIEQV